MFDIAYVLGTLLFFGMMAAYVAACAKLGQRTPADEESK